MLAEPIPCTRTHLTDDHVRRLAALVGRMEASLEEHARTQARLEYVREQMLSLARDQAVSL